VGSVKYHENYNIVISADAYAPRAVNKRRRRKTYDNGSLLFMLFGHPYILFRFSEVVAYFFVSGRRLRFVYVRNILRARSNAKENYAITLRLKRVGSVLLFSFRPRTNNLRTSPVPVGNYRYVGRRRDFPDGFLRSKINRTCRQNNKDKTVKLPTRSFRATVVVIF